MIDPIIKDRVAIVTGTNNPHGTGAAIAETLAAQGVKVCAQYFRANNEIESTGQEMGEQFYRAQQNNTADWLVDKIQSNGGEAIAVEVDLADPASSAHLFDQAERLGPVEILINNAAYSEADTFVPQGGKVTGGGFESNVFSTENFDKHIAVNARAVGLLMTEFARRHKERGGDWGRIVNISSDGAPAFASEVSYGASKYALESLSRSAAQEFGRFGITVNVASLGPIQSGWLAPEFEREIGEAIPLGRIGYPNDVADAVLLFVSEQARWLTGQVVYVGGGHRMV